MEEKSIELELRAEILLKERDGFHEHLEKLGMLHSHTKRLSVMYFGTLGSKKIDIRTRVTNGECEVVVKSGSFGAHDRVEVTQPISSEQFLGFVKIFAQFDFIAKVGEREIFNYILPDNITVSLVFAGMIAYIELEKMSSSGNQEENINQLRKVADRLGLHLLKSEKEFDKLCNRLDEEVDWPFHGSKEEYAKLSKLLNNYIK